MKPAYDLTSLRNLDIVKSARTWLDSGIISKDQFAAIQENYKSDFFHPNLFIRIALFIATVIALGGVTGLVGLLFQDILEDAIEILCFIYGIGSFISLEQVFIKKNHYKSGVNEALIYHSIGFSAGGLAALTDSNEPGVIFCFLIFFAFAAFRYLDLISTLGAIGCFAYFVFIKLFGFGGAFQQLIPVFMLVLFTPVYFLSRKLGANKKNWPWFDCITILQASSLLIIYAAGNYFVVRELSVSMLYLDIPEGGDIPFAFIFYSLTIIIPIVYLYFGIKNKDAVLLRVSLAVLAFSVFTFKYYYSTGHHEITFTSSGILLIAIAMMLFRYLKTPKRGYTPENIMKEKWAEANPEALLISQTLGGNKLPVEEGFQGQGGGFSGGGSTGSY